MSFPPTTDGLSLRANRDDLEPILDALAERIAQRIAPPPEPYLNVEQAAEYLACDKRRIYDLKERGAIPTFQDGKRLLLRRRDLDEYVSNLTCH